MESNNGNDEKKKEKTVQSTVKKCEVSKLKRLWSAKKLWRVKTQFVLHSVKLWTMSFYGHFTNYDGNKIWQLIFFNLFYFHIHKS